jgi:uncharacterized protein (TIGR03790 family)
MRGRRRSSALLGLLVWVAVASPLLAGLAPHEVLVLVNRNSPHSLEAANWFVDARSVPARNVVYLDLPDSVRASRAEMTPAAFTRLIWEPALAAMAERELEKHILAWVYSVDFPIRITTQPAVSLMGMTLLRNQFPADERVVEVGAYRSPFFAGPLQPDGERALGGSLFAYRLNNTNDWPMPSMMLGYVGARGTDMATVRRVIADGVRADRSMPRRTVYYVTGNDVRAKTRNPQFEAAQAELQSERVVAEIVDQPPGPDQPVMGLQMGVQYVDTDRVGRLLPGSMAEHLTSLAAVFHSPLQTKLSDWLRAGATASAGTVVEPYAIPMKFPQARFFPHYARGHTMLESFYLATASPLQLLIVGEPLSRPWSPPQSVTVISLDEGPISGQASFAMQRFPPLPGARHLFRVFVDDGWVSDTPVPQSFSFDSRELADGYHRLQVVAYALQPAVHSVSGELEFWVNNHGRHVEWLEPAAEVNLYQPLVLAARLRGDLTRAAVYHNERQLAVAEAVDGVVRWAIDPTELGAGPVWLQVRAETAAEAGEPVRSAPRRLLVQPRQSHPLLAAAQAHTARMWPVEKRAAETGEHASLEWRETGMLVRPGGREEHRLVRLTEPLRADERVIRFGATMTWPADRPQHPTKGRAGVVWDVRDARNFSYLLLDGATSSWIMGHYRDGEYRTVVARGAMALRGTPQRLDVVFEEGEVRALIQGEPVARMAGPAALTGADGWGVWTDTPAVFEQVDWAVFDQEEAKQ